MKNGQNYARVLSLLLFSAGIVLSSLLVLGTAWADLEAKFYNFQQQGDEPIDVTCPVFLAQDEVGRVSVRVVSEADIPINPIVRAVFSNRGLFRLEETRLSLDPGEAEVVTWEVSADDVGMRYFVFVKVFIPPTAQFISREGTCGAMILPFSGVTGNQVFVASLIVSFLGMGIGAVVWNKSHKPLNGRNLELFRAMQFLTIVALAGAFLGYRGFWGAAGLMLVIIILVLAGIFYLVFAK